MLSQQLEDKFQHLETRVAALETELAQMQQMLSVFVQKKTPWWLKVAGSFENDPTLTKPIASVKNGANLLNSSL